MNQILLMPAPTDVAGRNNRDVDGRFHLKRGVFVVGHSADASSAVRRNWPLNPLAFDADEAGILPETVMNSQQWAVTPLFPAGTEEGDLASDKLSALRAFKGGVALLAAGGVVAAATLVVATPPLAGVSALLTMAGGAIAAGATERYRRGA
jgi:hypothetical protein